MTAENLYRAPAADLTKPPRDSTGVSAGIIDQLGRTKGWVLFVSIMLFIGAVLMVLGAGTMIVTMSMINGAGNGVMGLGFGIGMGSMYLVFGVLYLWMGLCLFKFSTAIGRSVESNRAVDVEDAMDQQRKFWKTTGILMIVGIAMGLLGVVAAVAIPMFAGIG